VTFRHGVATGDPLPDGVVLWTRVTPPGDEPAEVNWTVARDEALADVVACCSAVALPEQDFTVHVDAAGLAPGTDHW